MGLFDGPLYSRVDDQVGFRNLDILLKVQQGELELGKLSLGYRDTCKSQRRIGQVRQVDMLAFFCTDSPICASPAFFPPVLSILIPTFFELTYASNQGVTPKCTRLCKPS